MPDTTLLTIDGLADAAIAGVDALPWGAHALAAVALGVGIVMWLTGRRLLKPIYAVLFAILGAAVGFAGPASVGLAVDPNIGLVIGLVVGLVLGLLLFRVTMAVTLAGVAAVAAPLAVAAVINLSEARSASHGFPNSDSLVAQIEREREGVRDDIHGTHNSMTGEPGVDQPGEERSENTVRQRLETAGMEAYERVRAVAVSSWRDISARVDAMPASHQAFLLLAVIVGGAIGFSLGFAFPGKVSAVATSFVGAAVWLAAAAWLLALLGHPIGAVRGESAVWWLTVWALVSMAGVVLQWTALRPRADESR